MTTAPRRAFRLTLELDADTADDMASALCNLAALVERGEVTVGTWGSPSDGALYELLTDPAMTHEAYFEKVREYLRGKVDQ